MAEKLKVVGSQNFAQGWVTAVPAHLIDEGATPNVQNVDFSESFGRLTKRRGHSLLLTARAGGSEKICGLYEFVNSAGTARLVAATLDDIYEVTAPGTWTSIHTDSSLDGTPVQFETFNDLCIIVGEQLTSQKWTGTGATSALGGTPPANVKHVQSHKRRLFMANSSAGTSRLHYSALDDAEDWTTVSDAGFIDINDRDGDVITGLCSLGSVLLIFKKRSIFALYGNSPSNFSIAQLSPSVGCANPKTIVKCDKFCIFLSADGVYSCNDDGPVLLNYNIKPTIDAITDTARGIAAAGKLRTQYWLAIDTDADGVNDEVYVLDYVYGVWGRYTNKKEHVFYRRYNGTLISGGADTDVIRLHDDTDNDNGSAINMIWDTKDYDGEDWTVKKYLRDLKVVAEPISAKAITISHLINGIVQGDTITFTLTATSTEDKVYLGFTPATNHHFPVGSNGQYFRFRFSNNQTSARVKLLGYSAGYLSDERRTGA